MSEEHGTARPPGIVFTMRYSDDIGYVWNSMARAYDQVAAVLAPCVRSFLAYPRLTGTPAFTPTVLEPLEADFYSCAAANRPRLASVVADHNVRLIFYMGCEPSEVSLPFLRRLGVRTINYEQESYPVDRQQSLIVKAAKEVLRSWLHYDIHDLYVANSEHQRRFLRTFARLPASRIAVAVNGIDTDLFRPGARPDPADYGLPRTQHYALSVCQARPEKRVDFLIDVAATLFRNDPDLSLTFVHVGGGECEQAWRARAAASGLGERFCFLGFRNDVAPLHRLSSVLVHAAERESFGFALAEAMASGRPVIATDAPGPREVIVDGETGFLVGRNDRDAFVSAVHRVVTDSALRAKLGTAAYAHSLAHYSHRTQVDNLVRAIRRDTIIADALPG